MILTILKYPDPFLRKTAEPISEFNETLKSLAGNMLETMYVTGGVGLAAPQVGQSIRLIVVDISKEKDSPLILVNPILTSYSDDMQEYREGCLSFPRMFAPVKSHESITVLYQDISGNNRTLEASGFLAVAIQHEMDHLNGILFIDRVPEKERNKMKVAILNGGGNK